MVTWLYYLLFHSCRALFVTLLKEMLVLHLMLSFCSLCSYLSWNSLVPHKQLSSLIRHQMSFIVTTAHDSRFTLPIERSLKGGAGLYV